MRRREVIAGLAGATAGWPRAVSAQQPAMPVIGFLSSESPALFASFLGAFRHGLNEAGLCRGPECRDRIPVGRRTKRALAYLGRRFGSPSGERDCRAWFNSRGAGGTAGLRYNPDRHPHWGRSGCAWARRQPQPPRRQRDGRNLLGPRTCAEAAGAFARTDAYSERHGAACQSDQYGAYRDHHERRAGCCPRPRAAAPCSARRAPNATSMPFLQLWSNCGQARS